MSDSGVERRRRRVETLRLQVNFLKVKLALAEDELAKEKRLLRISERVRNEKEEEVKEEEAAQK